MNYLLLIFLLVSIFGCALELEEDEISTKDNRNIVRNAVANVSSNGTSCSISMTFTMLGVTSNSTECYESDTMNDDNCDGLKALLDFGLMFFDPNATTVASFSQNICDTTNSFGQCNDGSLLTRYYVGNASYQEEMCEEPEQVSGNDYEINKEWIAD